MTGAIDSHPPAATSNNTSVNSHPPTINQYVPAAPDHSHATTTMLNPPIPLNQAHTSPHAISNLQPAFEPLAVNMTRSTVGYIPQEDQVAAALHILGLSGFPTANLHQLGIGHLRQVL